MPSTGAFNVNKIFRGPTRIYLNCALPATNTAYSTFITTDTTSLGNDLPTDGLLLGYTEAGAKVAISYTETSEEADETATPFNKVIATEVFSVEGSFFQMEDFAVLKRMSPTGTYVTGATWEALVFGGLSSLSTMAQLSVLVIGPSKLNPQKNIGVMLYKAINSGGLGFDWTRKKSSSNPFKFEGLTYDGRSAGDLVGQIFRFGTSSGFGTA